MALDAQIKMLIATVPRRQVVGKKRLQKLAYLCNQAGYQIEAHFTLRDYGPFSREIDAEASFLSLFGEILEEEIESGPYKYKTTVYISTPTTNASDNESYTRLLSDLDRFTTIDLEIASTIFFFKDETGDFDEAIRLTREMKPLKADPRIIRNATSVVELVSRHV